MLTLEKAENGFIIRTEDETTYVFQSEFSSMNHALGAVFMWMKAHLEDKKDTWETLVTIDMKK